LARKPSEWEMKALGEAGSAIRASVRAAFIGLLGEAMLSVSDEYAPAEC